MGRTNAVLHLHGLQHHQLRTGFDLLPGFDQHPHDAAVHGRAEATVVGMAGIGFGDRVEQGDRLQFALPVQVQGIATTDGQVLTAQPIMVDLQLFADQALVWRGALGQGDGLLVVATAQVQAGLCRQAGTKARGRAPG
ncbi:hypothetical protein D3C80_1184620 [compost metagenome]